MPSRTAATSYPIVLHCSTVQLPSPEGRRVPLLCEQCERSGGRCALCLFLLLYCSPALLFSPEGRVPLLCEQCERSGGRCALCLFLLLYCSPALLFSPEGRACSTVLARRAWYLPWDDILNHPGGA